MTAWPWELQDLVLPEPLPGLGCCCALLCSECCKCPCSLAGQGGGRTSWPKAAVCEGRLAGTEEMLCSGVPCLLLSKATAEASRLQSCRQWEGCSRLDGSSASRGTPGPFLALCAVPSPLTGCASPPDWLCLCLGCCLCLQLGQGALLRLAPQLGSARVEPARDTCAVGQQLGSWMSSCLRKGGT